MPSALPLPADDCFALLDDASADTRRSRLYTSLHSRLDCSDAASLPALLDRLEQAQAAGLHAVGLFSYELGAAMHAIEARSASAFPLASLLLFERCDLVDSRDTAHWLAQMANNEPCGIAQIEAGMDETAFCQAVETIQRYIKAGDTYQANLTFPLHFQSYGDPIALYTKLRARQPVPYGALIRLPDASCILSLSPELFVAHTQGKLTAKPMKGTAAASGIAAQDRQQAQKLAANPKDRAENLMIVDLLRNDLGRVAQTGSVQVPALFEVDRFGSVLQMTSTINAKRRADATLADLFGALYPCGSITGAPKRRTMQILREIEASPRGLYTGAIGWFDAPDARQSIGDFILSVPIRTLLLSPPDEAGLRSGGMSVGAGIVHDSLPKAEYAESLLKARFLTGLPAEFELFETMQASSEGCPCIELHLSRLGASAAYFGFECDAERIRDEIKETCATLETGMSYRMRLSLQQSGAVGLQCTPLAPLLQPVSLLLATPVMQSGSLFLRHKTSLRHLYDAGWRAAEAIGAFDALFFNERGELTEGGRSTIFVQLDGEWLTPPLSAGILPGVMRSVVLADPAMKAREQTLMLSDLRNAQAIMACNALRGKMTAKVEWDAAPLTLN